MVKHVRGMWEALGGIPSTAKPRKMAPDGHPPSPTETPSPSPHLDDQLQVVHVPLLRLDQLVNVALALPLHGLHCVQGLEIGTPCGDRAELDNATSVNPSRKTDISQRLCWVHQRCFERTSPKERHTFAESRREAPLRAPRGEMTPSGKLQRTPDFWAMVRE